MEACGLYSLFSFSRYGRQGVGLLPVGLPFQRPELLEGKIVRVAVEEGRC
jgi:hypothetical protein